MTRTDRASLMVLTCVALALVAVGVSGVAAQKPTPPECARQIGEYGLVAMKKAPDGREVECHYVKRGPKAAREAAKR